MNEYFCPYSPTVASEGEQHTIRLWKVNAGIRLGMEKGKLARSAKGDTDGNVLVARSLRVESRAIMVERFPIATVAIPIKSRTNRGVSDGEIVRDLLLDSLKGWRVAWILRDQMSAFMPGNPLAAFHPAVLHVSHLVYKLIVESPIVLGAEEIGNNDHVVMFQSSWAFVLACHQNAHVGANK